MELTAPWALLLLVAVPAALFAQRRSLAGLSDRRSAAATMTRLAMLVLLVVAAAGPRLKLGSSDLSVVFLVDASASVSPEGRRRAVEVVEAAAAGAATRDRVGVVVFGGDASVERALREGGLGSRLDRIVSTVRTDATDIAAALRLAAGLVPDGTTGRLVLLSDGNETTGGAVDEARRLNARGVEIYCVPLAAGGRPEVAVEDVRLPESPAPGESFDLRVGVTATRDTAARLRIYRNGVPVAERDVHLAAGGANVFLLPQRLEERGFYTYRAEVEAIASDGFVQNNSREAFAHVEGPPRALYVFGDDAPSAQILAVLEEGRFGATVARGPTLPPRLADLQHYDLVVFDNVTAESLASSQLADVRAYVRDLGGGFVMIGGDKSFGAGGYYKTPVEDALPVLLDVRQKKHFPGLALVLVIDKSGSMAGSGDAFDKMMLAKEGAIAAVEFLSETDAAGVIAFDDAAKVVVPLEPLEGRKEEVTRLIGTIQSGGGTTIYPALDEAFRQLAASDAPLKHVLLLSDGQSNEGDYAGLVTRMREARVTLSTVAVGADADLKLMEYLAKNTGGRFYVTENVGTLPRVMTKEAVLAARATVIEEPTAAVPAQPSRTTAGIDWRAAPALGGYVGTAPRELATTALVTHRGDPLFAEWQYGLGRSAAFTSDAKPRWASGWIGWDGFGAFWTQVFRDVVRRASDESLRPEVRIANGRGHVTADAYTPSGSAANGLDLRGRVVAPDGTASEVTLRQTAPGRYEAAFDAPGEGAYLVSLVREGGPGPRVTGAVQSYSAEFDVREADRELLERVAGVTGGRLEEDRDTLAQTLFSARRATTRARDVWQWLVALALLLLPLDVGLRRVRMTRTDLAAAAAWARARFGREAAATLEPVAPSLEALKARKQRAVISVDRPAPPRSVNEREPQPPVAPARPPTVTEPPAEEPPPEDWPLAGRLLDARRRRREQ